LRQRIAEDRDKKIRLAWRLLLALNLSSRGFARRLLLAPNMRALAGRSDPALGDVLAGRAGRRSGAPVSVASAAVPAAKEAAEEIGKNVLRAGAAAAPGKKQRKGKRRHAKTGIMALLKAGDHGAIIAESFHGVKTWS
jgi:hypothetical protein